jgi:hypothetical protein
MPASKKKKMMKMMKMMKMLWWEGTGKTSCRTDHPAPGADSQALV